MGTAVCALFLYKNASLLAVFPLVGTLKRSAWYYPLLNYPKTHFKQKNNYICTINNKQHDKAKDK